MFDKFYGFDAEKMSEMFKTADMTKFFETARMPMFDMEALAAAQQKNMEALIEANRAAATGYQTIFKAQVAMFEESMTSLQKQMAEMKMDQMTGEGASRQVELLKDGFEKSLASLNELADTAQKTNGEAFEIVRARVQESLDEMKAMAAKTPA